jgi:hypothetical protein
MKSLVGPPLRVALDLALAGLKPCPTGKIISYVCISRKLASPLKVKGTFLDHGLGQIVDVSKVGCIMAAEG